MRKRIMLAALLLASLFCVGFIYRTQARTQFEYKFETAPSERKANELASQGWELIAVESAGAGRITPTYIFKRAK